MPFTDDDLKQIKKEAEALGGERFRALIVRLEAAERYVETVAPDGNLGDFDEDAYKAWRKAAGK